MGMKLASLFSSIKSTKLIVDYNYSQLHILSVEYKICHGQKLFEVTFS